MPDTILISKVLSDVIKQTTFSLLPVLPTLVLLNVLEFFGFRDCTAMSLSSFTSNTQQCLYVSHVNIMSHLLVLYRSPDQLQIMFLRFNLKSHTSLICK